MAPEFLALLRRAADQFPTQRAFADALGLKLQRVNAALQGRGYPFNLRNCLRLARLANVPPSLVLRAAGKHTEAELIERLYGSATLSSAQRDLLDLWGHLPLAQRAALLTVLHGLVTTPAFPPAGPPPVQRRRKRPRP